MFEDVLSKAGMAVLDLLVSSSITDRFYLAGGTGASLQLGHRESHDLDFFAPDEFDTTALVQQLSSIGQFQLTGESWGTVHGILDDVRVTFMYYEYSLLFPTVDLRGVKIADLRDIGLMKIVAISSRGSRRDFIDLYVICNHTLSLGKLLELFSVKYKGVEYSTYHLIKSLAYFDDAKRDPNPIMRLDIPWQKVEDYFRREQRALLARYSS